MSNLSKNKQVAFAIIGFGLLIFMNYAWWVATPETLKTIGDRQIDKIAHFSGGLFIALFAEMVRGRPRLFTLLVGLFAITIGWEIFEFYSSYEVRRLYEAAPHQWRFDSLGDILAALVAGSGYWLLHIKRKQGVSRWG